MTTDNNQTHAQGVLEKEPPTLSFKRLIGTNIAVKFQLDVINQIFNPFLTIIAVGFGIDVVTLGRLLSLRSLAGITTPFIGSLAESIGYRTMIRLCLFATAIGSFLIGISTNLSTAVAGLLLTGIATAGFVPVIHAYSSAYLPYEKRARGMGIIEYSWALASIVGLSIMGVVINSYGWRAPFLILGVGLLIAWLVFGTMPEAPRQEKREQIGEESLSLDQKIKTFFDLGPNARSAYSAICAQGFTFFAAMQLTIAYGAWFATEYGLDPIQLGQVALVVGCFDLLGSISVSLFTDRIGKQRSCLIGNIGMLLGFILLPWLNTGTLLAIFSLALIRGFFEFAIVSAFPLLSIQDPEQPAKVLSLGSTFTWIAGAGAGLTGPWLYVNYGINSVAIISSISVCVAILFLWMRVQDDAISPDLDGDKQE